MKFPLNGSMWQDNETGKMCTLLGVGMMTTDQAYIAVFQWKIGNQIFAMPHLEFYDRFTCVDEQGRAA